MEKRIEALEAKADDVDSDLVSQQSSITEVERLAADNASEVSDLHEKIDAMEGRLYRLESRVDQLEA